MASVSLGPMVTSAAACTAETPLPIAYAGAGQPEHFQVCKIIAKGGDPVYGQAAGGADGRQSIGLGGSGFGDLVPVFFTGKAANITVRQSRLQRFDLLISGYLGTDLQRIQGKVPEIRPNDFRPGRGPGPLVAVIVPKWPCRVSTVISVFAPQMWRIQANTRCTSPGANPS